MIFGSIIMTFWWYMHSTCITTEFLWQQMMLLWKYRKILFWKMLPPMVQIITMAIFVYFLSWFLYMILDLDEKDERYDQLSTSQHIDLNILYWGQYVCKKFETHWLMGIFFWKLNFRLMRCHRKWDCCITDFAPRYNINWKVSRFLSLFSFFPFYILFGFPCRCLLGAKSSIVNTTMAALLICKK